ncbi:MAG: TIGR00266 family protein [Gammaproteobacteria bacterium]|nr:TIGR00266 family protein [Gammaproteobacteria bacterium]
MAQWYLSYDGRQIGPLDQAAASTEAGRNPNGLAWREGLAEWLPIQRVAELSGTATAHTPPPPPPAQSSSDEIDYEIFGGDMQYVEVELDPGESAVAEAGAMMYKDPAIGMTTLFGDGSRRSEQGRLVDKLVGAGKRVLTGESLFVTAFTHNGTGKARVAFAAPYPGTIIPVTLANYGGTLICQKDSFLAAARGVSIGIYFQKRVLTALFGGEGFIMQKLDGHGLVFLHAGGTITERELGEGETLHVDTGCLVAMTASVQFDLEQAGDIKSMVFGGEGMFFARVGGPGRVWLQSLPFSRLAGRMHQAAPQTGGTRRGEGSVLGALGGLLDGDNRF